MKLDTNVKYYFMCRFKLNDNNIEPICAEIQSLFEINADTKSLSEQLNYWAQQYLLELDENKRADLFRFDKHNKAGFAKLKFTLRETESNESLRIQFYALCRHQLDVPLSEILNELKCLFEDVAPKRSDLIRWIINSTDEPFPVESFQLDEANQKHRTLRIECKTSTRSSVSNAKELRKAKEAIIDLQDRLATVLASSSSSSNLTSPNSSFKKESLNESQIPDLINSFETEASSQLVVRELKRKLTNVEDTNATLNFNLFKQNKEIEQMKHQLVGREQTVRALNDKLIEYELKHMRDVNTSSLKYDSLKKEFDAKLAEISSLNQNLNLAEQKLKETESSLNDFKQKCKSLEEKNKTYDTTTASSEEISNQRVKEDIQKFIKQIDELQKENENLKQENERATNYANEYVTKLSEFERNLIKERNEVTDSKAKLQLELDELKKQMNESNLKAKDSLERYDNLFKLYVSLNESKQRLEQTIEEIHVNQNPKLVEEIITRRQLAKETVEINQLKQSLTESNEMIAKLKTDLNESLRDKTTQIDQLKQQESVNLDKIKSLEKKMEQDATELQNLKEINARLESNSASLSESTGKLKEIIKSLEKKLDEQTEMNESSEENMLCQTRLKELYERFNFDSLIVKEEHHLQQQRELSMSYYVDKMFSLLKKYKIKMNELTYDLDEQTSELTKCKDDIRRWKTVNNELTLKNEELSYALTQLTKKQQQQAELNASLKHSFSGVFNDVIDLTDEVNGSKGLKRKLEDTTNIEDQFKYQKV